MEAILTMTKSGGEAMGLPVQLGQVKEGFLADLLLVSGNPLENVRLLQDPANFLAIVKDGQFHKIDRRLMQKSESAYSGS
jgi:imidazolonepropionase-like amidohydrolase